MSRQYVCLTGICRPLAPKRSGSAGSPWGFSTESFKLSTVGGIWGYAAGAFPSGAFAQLDEGMQLTVKRSLRIINAFSAFPRIFITDYAGPPPRDRKRCGREAKRAGDFSLFSPWLDKMISMTRQYVGYAMEPEKDVYEVLLGYVRGKGWTAPPSTGFL